VFALVIPLHSIPAAHTAKHCLSQARAAPPQSFHFAGSISFIRRVGTCSARKKTTLHGKKSRQPCVFHVGSRSPHSATLHCGLFASATLAPLADGSRLSTPQAKKSLRYRYANFLLAPFRLRAVLPALFLATPTPAPDHPPLKPVDFLFYLRYHAGFEITKYPNCQNGNMAI
jgi:hypothetical protein